MARRSSTQSASSRARAALQERVFHSRAAHGSLSSFLAFAWDRRMWRFRQCNTARPCGRKSSSTGPSMTAIPGRLAWAEETRLPQSSAGPAGSAAGRAMRVLWALWTGRTRRWCIGAVRQRRERGAVAGSLISGVCRCRPIVRRHRRGRRVRARRRAWCRRRR